jgi:hypothetical protein
MYLALPPQGAQIDEIEKRSVSGSTRMHLKTAHFYAATFPNSEVTAVHKAPADYPSGKAAMS